MTLHVDKQPDNSIALSKLQGRIIKLLEREVCFAAYGNSDTLGFIISIEHFSPQGERDTTVVRYENNTLKVE
mgnify:CR=1 FL=1